LKLVMIAAVARNGAIGKGNQLLWREPLDQKHFRSTTLGHTVLMGRKTWDSLPERFRPLPGRRNLVLTRTPQTQFVGAETATSLHQALDLTANEDKVFVMGGAQIYAQALPLAQRLVLTELDADLPGDVFFPTWRRDEWALTSSTEPHQDAQGRRFAFVTYDRTS
jgi:dihydrofolate reductase